MIIVKRILYGYEIRAEVTLLKNDIHILLTGGSRPHIGAMSLFCDGREEGAAELPGHKEKRIADFWAGRLSEEFHCRTAVVCGIHYDDLTKEQIMRIVSLTEDMLQEAIRIIERENENI